ncbi:hypothetical protein BGZ73_007835 [Actinomortierella ambigua]|nr:hypothetical protein BGZ73_007835 [Actinomortierella ambigua]
MRLPKDPHLMSQRVLKLARQGKLDDAIMMVKEAPNSLQNEVVWNHLIDEAGRIGKANLALRLLNDMKKCGLEPTERTYTIALKALAKNPSSPETVTRAQDIYAQMQERGVTPNLVHTNALLKVLGRAGDLEAMHNVYAKMPRQGPLAPDTITYNTVIGAYAWKVWGECLQAKIKRPDAIDIDERLMDSLLVAVRRSERRSKNGMQVVESLYGLELMKRKPSIREQMSHPEYMHSRRDIYPGESLGLGPVLANKMPSFQTVDLVLQVAAKADQLQAGHAFVEWVEKTFADQFVPDMQLLSALTVSYNKSRNFDKTLACLDIYHQRRLPEPSVVFFQQVLEALYVKRETSSRAFELVKEMLSLTEQGVMLRKDGRPAQRMDSIALALFGSICKRGGRWQEGLEVLERAQWQKVITQSDHSKSNHGISQFAIYVLQESLRHLKKELRRDDFYLEQRQHPDATRQVDDETPKLLSKTAKKQLQDQIAQREQELRQALELEDRFAQQRKDKAQETRANYRDRKRPKPRSE